MLGTPLCWPGASSTHPLAGRSQAQLQLAQLQLALSPGLFFSLNVMKETNRRTDGRTREKNRPGIYCRDCSAHALKITQNLGNRIFCRVLFRKLYSFNFLQRCFYRFFPPAGIPVPWLQPGRSLFQPTTSSRQVFCSSSSKFKTVRSFCTCLDCSLFVTVRL